MDSEQFWKDNYLKIGQNNISIIHLLYEKSKIYVIKLTQYVAIREFVFIYSQISGHIYLIASSLDRRTLFLVWETDCTRTVPDCLWTENK